MAQTKIILCDTNIIIEYFKGNSSVIGELKHIGDSNIYISIITSGELLFGALNKIELQKIQKKIELISQIPINEAISDIFTQLMIKYSLSHQLSIPDAFIAATALYYDVDLYTFNKKDFRFIPGIRLYK
jgi:predicted nucleic acid-binding protein